MDDQCGEYAASFIPRWGTYFSCVLPKGHEGEHRAGGECFKHGKYVMEHFGETPKCPKWPDCIKIQVKESNEN
jgi:hypothetical protein